MALLTRLVCYTAYIALRRFFAILGDEDNDGDNVALIAHLKPVLCVELTAIWQLIGYAKAQLTPKTVDSDLSSYLRAR